MAKAKAADADGGEPGELMALHLDRLENSLEVRLSPEERKRLAGAGLTVVYILSDAAYRMRMPVLAAMSSTN